MTIRPEQLLVEQEDELDVLARAVVRLSLELADQTVISARYRRALDRIGHDPFVTNPVDVAREALS